jgi:hypothetical protein
MLRVGCSAVEMLCPVCNPAVNAVLPEAVTAGRSSCRGHAAPAACVPGALLLCAAPVVPVGAGAKSALLLSNFPSVVSVNLRARPSKVLEADCILDLR